MLNILWNASHLWGYVILYALRSAGVPCRVLKASEIAQDGVSGKVLFVPGGGARAKAAALGAAGMAAVRSFVEKGGHYLGICGGAGLALSSGIGLSPWRRAGMSDRLQHLVSGHVLCSLEQDPLLPPSSGPDGKDGLVPLPVWWPGRFEEPEKGSREYGDVCVLARYRAPGPDLHVADLPLSLLPEEVLAEWRTLYGVSFRPSLLDGSPCMTAGNFGRGEWLLSYSHLETPDSPEAGRCFAHLLKLWGVADAAAAERLSSVSAWNLTDFHNESVWPVRWEEPELLEAWGILKELFELAQELGLLFPRSGWLMGWRSGVPGAQLNGLRAALRVALGQEPSRRRLALWREEASSFAAKFGLFAQGARSWLLARRLADTLADSLPGMLPKALLADQKTLLFGSPMSSGGLCGELQNSLEELLFA